MHKGKDAQRAIRRVHSHREPNARPAYQNLNKQTASTGKMVAVEGSNAQHQ